jgi:hypothetical protein
MAATKNDMTDFRVLKPIRHKGKIVTSGRVSLDHEAHKHLLRRGVLALVADDAAAEDDGKASGGKAGK